MFCQRIVKLKTSPQHLLRQMSTKLGIAGVKNVVLISSAKGGVGKSATTVALGTALKHIDPSLQIGILDADVFGPSIPRMMALKGQPEVTKQKLMKPLTNFGIKCISMGFLVEEESAMVWRGLMVMSAIQKLLFGVQWGPLDYLLIDMPPGTGDTQLSIAQSIPINGAIVVTTPQDIALMDARRGVTMFTKTNVPVLGIIQNMSVFVCENCGHESHIFGDNGAKSLANELNVELLGDIPLDVNIRKCCDSGQPFVLMYPKSKCTEVYLQLGHKIINK
ncbi:iron-sulfur protein NUBPL-like, partial [Oppia nitens]|uniref:iron-sulfur protein NUBPL-like n=1 Tax=Oppia nitens TaxID=1686743 RepID=UPI0023DC2D0E